MKPYLIQFEYYSAELMQSIWEDCREGKSFAYRYSNCEMAIARAVRFAEEDNLRVRVKDTRTDKVIDVFNGRFS